MSDVKLIPGLPTGASISAREDHGKEALAKHPIEAIADWRPPADRPRATDLLVGQEGSRIQALVPIRHERMAQTPFTFYRGAAIVMASDLGRSSNSDLWAQLCGDAHLSNFGVFGSAERQLVFDVNDFDETSPGPFEWDLMRLVASIVLALREQGAPDEEVREVVKLAAQAYQFIINGASTQPYLKNWYTMITSDDIRNAIMSAQAEAKSKVVNKQGKKFDKAIQKVRARDTWSAVEKLTEVGPDGQRRFLNQPPLLVRLADIPAAMHVTPEYYDTLSNAFVDTVDIDRRSLLSRYKLLDIAHKVVGVGSVGLPALIGLMQGRDEKDLMVLQFKAAEASVLEEWTRASQFGHHGQRVVVGQRMMQAAGDPFLGWMTGPGGTDFYGRQLRDFKWSVDLNGLKRKKFTGYVELCATALALAHSRGGDPIAFAAYVGTGEDFSNAMVEFALTYAALVEEDYKDFAGAIASGELAAADNVDMTAASVPGAAIQANMAAASEAESAAAAASESGSAPAADAAASPAPESTP